MGKGIVTGGKKDMETIEEKLLALERTFGKDVVVVLSVSKGNIEIFSALDKQRYMENSDDDEEVPAKIPELKGNLKQHVSYIN